MKKVLYERKKGKSINYSTSVEATSTEKGIYYALFAGIFFFIGLSIILYAKKQIILGIVCDVIAAVCFVGVFVYTFNVVCARDDAKVTITKKDTDYTYNGIKGETVDYSVTEVETKTIEQLKK